MINNDVLLDLFDFEGGTKYFDRWFCLEWSTYIDIIGNFLGNFVKKTLCTHLYKSCWKYVSHDGSVRIKGSNVLAHVLSLTPPPPPGAVMT